MNILSVVELLNEMVALHFFFFFIFVKKCIYSYEHKPLYTYTDVQCKLLVIDKKHGCDYNTVNWQNQHTS